MRLFISFALFVAFCTLNIVWGIDAAVNAKAKNADFFYHSDRKVWGHRGYFIDAPENSVMSFQAALAKGAPGSEMDIFYDTTLNNYIVSHDYPYHLVNGEHVLLQDVISSLPEEFNYWFDFKNLMYLNDRDLELALSRLIELNTQFNIASRSLVESENAYRGQAIRNIGFNASYWLNIAPNTSGLKFYATLYKTKLLYLWGAFDAISMDYLNFDTRMQAALADIPVLLFTVDNPTLLATYRSNPRIRIVLTDTGNY